VLPQAVRTMGRALMNGQIIRRASPMKTASFSQFGAPVAINKPVFFTAHLRMGLERGAITAAAGVRTWTLRGVDELRLLDEPYCVSSPCG